MSPGAMITRPGTTDFHTSHECFRLRRLARKHLATSPATILVQASQPVPQEAARLPTKMLDVGMYCLPRKKKQFHTCHLKWVAHLRWWNGWRRFSESIRLSVQDWGWQIWLKWFFLISAFNTRLSEFRIQYHSAIIIQHSAFIIYHSSFIFDPLAFIVIIDLLIIATELFLLLLAIN